MMKKKQLGSDLSESREDKFMLPGIDFKAKLIGIEPVAQARGDKMCLDAMIKLKYLVKSTGEHKPRIIVNVSIEGIRILDEKTREILHQHEVHRISFISRDPTDVRAFGFVHGDHGDHKFYGIKTEKQANVLVMTLKDLFEVVLDLKKKQIADQKKVEQITGQSTAQTSSEKPIHASFKNPPPMEDEEKENAPTSDPVYAEVKKPKLSQIAAGLSSDMVETTAAGLLDLEQDIKNLQMGIDTMEEFEFNPETPTSPKAQSDQFASPPPQPSASAAFGSVDPFAAQVTSAPVLNSAPPPASSAPSDDLFKEFKDTFTAPTPVPAPSPITAFQTPAVQSTPNPFGQSAPAAPFQANFGAAPSMPAAYGGAPGGFDAQPAAFSGPPPQPAADPFGGEMGFNGGVLMPDSTPNQLATDLPKGNDPFSDFGALGSAKTEAPKSVKEMFTNYKIGKPGEPQAAPEIKLTGGPKRPPPAIPSNTAPASNPFAPGGAPVTNGTNGTMDLFGNQLDTFDFSNMK